MRKGRGSRGPVQVRSWKSIQQRVSRAPGGASRRSRRRSFLVWAAAVVFSVGIIFASYLLLFETERLFGAGPEFPIREIVYETDGTLDRDWALGRLSLAENASLLQTDIFRLRERLASHPQVADCVVRRHFPETLEIRLTEHKPVLRIMVRGEANRILYVARDGSIFPGIGRDPRETRRMPFLTGIRLVDTPAGYRPIPGFRTVADLVATAASGFPELFRTWRIVDLSLYDPDPEAPFSAIRVRTTGIGEVLFGTEDIPAQLLRLQDIVTVTGRRGVERLERVDLRFDDSVPVLLEGGT